MKNFFPALIVLLSVSAFAKSSPILKSVQLDANSITQIEGRGNHFVSTYYETVNDNIQEIPSEKDEKIRDLVTVNAMTFCVFRGSYSEIKPATVEVYAERGLFSKKTTVAGGVYFSCEN